MSRDNLGAPAASSTAGQDPSSLDFDIACPSCGYNMRGLGSPRCPECGASFDPDDFLAGHVRQNIPTWLDTADLWQPHQALIRSLAVLLQFARRPRLMGSLDLNGPLAPALIMLVLGLGWTYLLVAAAIGLATAIHSDCSPHIAAKSALLVWSPRLIGGYLPVAAVCLLMILGSRPLRIPSPTPRQRFRAACFWIPVQTFWAIAPIAVIISLKPDLDRTIAPAALLLGFLPITLLKLSYRKSASARASLDFPAGVLVLVGLAAVGYFLLIRKLLPDDLEPALWLYSL